VWDNGQGRFLTGRCDFDKHLDPQSWGYLALAGKSTAWEYGDALSWADANCYYAKGRRNPTHEGYDFDCNSTRNDIWYEGTAQMVLAFQLRNWPGDDTLASKYLGEIEKRQDQLGSGGVPYSLLGTHNGYWQMKDTESVTASGWYLFAKSGFNPFN
jgi:hypothetical protein